MSADPADDTNALLAQNNAILTQLLSGRNDSVPINSSLPSTEFSPTRDIFAVNALFSLSLAFAIISSFLAVLGRQWLVYYRKRGGGGPDRQRWEQLKRFRGAEWWKLEPLLDDVLPSLLQAGLIIFCVSLILYLRHLSPAISLIVGIPMYGGLAFLVGSAFCTAWDRSCPFQSPLSHALVWGALKINSVLRAIKGPSRKTPSTRSSIRKWVSMLAHGREQESPEALQVIALRRAICTSDDPATLLHATANIFGITNGRQMEELWSDTSFQERFLYQVRHSYNRMLQLRGHDQVNFATASQRLYSAAAAHIILLLNDKRRSIDQFTKAIRAVREASILIPSPQLQDSPAYLIRSTLSFTLIRSHCSCSFWQPPPDSLNRLRDHLATLTTILERQDWSVFCLVSFIFSNLPTLRSGNPVPIDSLRNAYRG